MDCEDVSRYLQLQLQLDLGMSGKIVHKFLSRTSKLSILSLSGTKEASQTWGDTTRRGHFFFKKKGYFLKVLGAHAPTAPWFLRLCFPLRAVCLLKHKSSKFPSLQLLQFHCNLLKLVGFPSCSRELEMCPPHFPLVLIHFKAKTM